MTGRLLCMSAIPLWDHCSHTTVFLDMMHGALPGAWHDHFTWNDGN